MTTADAGQDESRTKVGRVIEEYDLTGLGDELERRWTADEERWSLRKLADYVNKQILQCAFESHGRQSADEVVDNAHQILTDDGVSTSARMRLTRELEREDIDVEQLLDDFVSHQAIHTYLREYRGATPPAGQSDPVDTAEQAINRLQSRTAAVVSSNIDRLTDAGQLSVGDPDILVNVEVFCNECGSSKPIGHLLEQGSCDCPM